MRKKTLAGRRELLLGGLLCAILAVVGLAFLYGDFNKYGALAAGAIMVYLLAARELKPLKNRAAWPLFGFIIFAGLGAFWAIAGKFFLREYSKVFLASAFLLLPLLREKFDAAYARLVSRTITVVFAVYAFLSIEAATTGLVKRLVNALNVGMTIGFEDGTRLSGVLGNSNVEASVYAFGIFFAIALLCGAEERRDRVIGAVALAFNAYSFLLVFSMGAMAFFAVAIVFYLVFAGKGRGAALLRMLEGAVPTLLCVFAAYPCFNRGGIVSILPLLIMLLDAAIVLCLELKLSGRLIAVFDAHSKLTVGIVLGAVVLAAAYVLIAFHVTGAYTFGGSLHRGAYPAGGEHVLHIEADGDVQVSISSETLAEARMIRGTDVYSGDAAEAHFTLPEGSVVSYYTFSAEPGVTLYSARIDDDTEIPLDYKLLPGFAANRIQGMRYSMSALQRTVYYEDAIKLWKMSPIVGLGTGSFETGVFRVQQYYYETRFVHNHYLQILMEDGVIGLALWVAALISMLALLWKSRRKGEDWEFHWLYGALWAAFVMVAAQSYFDVSLSYTVFLCAVYAAFGMLLRICGDQEAVPEAVPAKKGKRSAAEAAKRRENLLLIKVCLCAIPLVFMFTIGLNLFANRLRRLPAPSVSELIGQTELSAKIDPYEYNDGKLGVITYVQQEEPQNHIAIGNRYAAELAKAQSNSLPAYLVAYYLNTEQYELAIDEAMQAAYQSASSHSTWNANIDLLSSVFVDYPESSPLLTDEAGVLFDKLLAYYDMLLERNATAMEEIQLNERSVHFFERVLAAAEVRGDPAQVYAALIG